MNAKLEMVIRLENRISLSNQVLTFLLGEGLIGDYEAKVILSQADIEQRSRDLLALLNRVSTKTQLMNFEWTLLPKEEMNLLIVTDRASQSFSWP